MEKFMKWAFIISQFGDSYKEIYLCITRLKLIIHL